VLTIVKKQHSTAKEVYRVNVTCGEEKDTP
jgi:hypothetical protein